MIALWQPVPSRTAEDLPTQNQPMGACNRPIVPGLWDGSRLRVVLGYAVNGIIERDQQRHVAGNDLRQHTHRGADLRSSALVCQ